jgi:hypothetical protein
MVHVEVLVEDALIAFVSISGMACSPTPSLSYSYSQGGREYTESIRHVAS